MTKKTFYFNCMECMERNQVKVVVDDQKDKFDVDRIKGKCAICKSVWTLAQLAS